MTFLLTQGIHFTRVNLILQLILLSLLTFLLPLKTRKFYLAQPTSIETFSL